MRASASSAITATTSSTLTLHDLVPSTEADELDALVARAHASGKLETATLSLVKSLTYPICVELRVLSHRHAGRARLRARRVRGVALARQRSERCRHALHHDPLTGLDNLTAADPARSTPRRPRPSTRARRRRSLLVDIDDYQRINRALGYDAGDDMLRETARRIQHAAGHGETRGARRERRVRRAAARRHDRRGGAAEDARPAPADARSRSRTGIADSTRICRRASASRSIPTMRS